MKSRFKQCTAVDGAMDRVTLDQNAGSGWKQRWKRRANRLLLVAAGLLPMAAAQAGVQATGVDMPNPIGLQMPFQAKVAWIRSTPGAADTVTVTLPPELALAPGEAWPSGCTLTGASLVCTIAANEREGDLLLPLVGVTTNGFNLAAIGNVGTGASASRTVRASGDLKVTKSKTSPSGDVIAGQNVEFLLEPEIAGGGSDVPAGATLVVTDTLPTSFTGATATPNGLPASCASNNGRLTCTYTGPFSAAQFNASSITVKGKQGAGNGGFTNLVSIDEGSDHLYLDRDNNNNGAQATYQVNPGSDIQGLISFPNGPHAAGDTAPKTLTLTYQNNGPMNSVGGTVQTVIPAGFVLDEATLPTSCVASSGSLQVPAGGTNYTGTVVTCTFNDAISANNGKKDFPLVVTLPSTQGSGNFPVLATPPTTLADPNPANNHATTPYSVLPPYANQELTKTKTPGTGPQKPGTEITTTLRVTNSTQSSSALTYSSPDHPLRVVDYLRPEEAKTDAYGAGQSLTSDSLGWQCTLDRNVTVPAGIDAARSTRVTCVTTNTTEITLNKGQSASVAFKTTIADMAPNAAPVELVNTACTGNKALSALGLPATAGPLPAYNTDSSLPQEADATVCKSAGQGLWGTPVGATPDSAIINVKKESSVDRLNWFDPVADAPTLAKESNKLYWRITITADAGAGQLTIPTLLLTDTLPGILANNLGNTTPAIPLAVRRGQPGSMVAVLAGTVDNNCPAQINAGANGSGAKLCTFKAVARGEVIEVIMDVSRPLGPGVAQSDGTWRLTNTATISSPDAVLSGTSNDSAAVDLAPRMDVELESKKLDVVTPAVGQRFTFRVEARNRGPFAVPVGAFTIEDVLFTGTPTLALPAYEILKVSSATGNLTCPTPTTAAGDLTTVSCVNTGGTIASGSTETMLIEVRLKKPTLNASHVAGSNLYTGATNKATVLLDDAFCEYRVDGSVSGACNDSNSTSNNDKTATFNVQVPRIDLEQGKLAIDQNGTPYPVGKARFNLGDTLRYRFTTTNFGPSQAVGVQMRDKLDLPPNFTLDTMTVVASQMPGSATLSCQRSTVDGNLEIQCHMGAELSESILEAGQSMIFDLALTLRDNRPVGDVGAVSFGNTAIACSDESMTYETNGKCSFDATVAGNNIAGLSHLVTPQSDLGVTKTTFPGNPSKTAVDINEPVEYQIVVDNKGINATNKIRIVDRLPTGFEWLTSGVHAPKVVAGGGSQVNALSVETQVPADGTDNVCFISNGVGSVSQANQYQQVTCDLGGMFPVADKVATVTLWARPVQGVYDGTTSAPFNTNRTNTVQVQPGRDAAGNEVSIDNNPGNDNSTSVVQVKTASLRGRVFADANDNGDYDVGDVGLNKVVVTLSGKDASGNNVLLSVETDVNGDYAFLNIAPSDASGYTITQAQPAAYAVNGQPQPNTPRAVRNGTSTGVSGTYTTTNTPTTSTIGGVVLASGGVGVQFDFPEPLERKLSGHVYIDQNNDKVMDGGDPRISGATVYLDEVGSTVTRATTTNAQGLYEFSGLTAGKTYVLREPLPSTPVGLVNQPLAVNPGKINNVACGIDCLVTTSGTEDQISGIKLVAGNGTDFNFGENLKTTLSGVVYLDSNNDGLKATSEPGIENVVIKLEVKDEFGNWVFVATLRNDNQGAYSYADAVIGKEYRLTETQPAGLANGQENGPAGTTADSVIETGALLATGSPNNNFGEVAASLSGVVYLDSNNNGVQDAGEPGLPNVEITLPAGTKDALGKLVATVATDADGNYAFRNLLAGTYVVTQQLAQPVYGGVTTHNGITTKGSAGGTVTAVSVVPSAISDIQLAAGGSSVLNNFGEILVASISGSVYVDRNDNGSFDAGDAGNNNSAPNGGIEGVVVVLYAADGTTEITRGTTDAQGGYSFSNLPTGVGYVVKELQPIGYAEGKQNNSNSISIGSLPVAGVTGQDFGELLGSLAGLVYEDFSGTALNNNNGRHDSGEKIIGGVTLTLTGTDANGALVNRVAISDSSTGTYSFGDLLAGSYVITETQPPAYIDGKHTVGTIGGSAQGSNAVANVISDITLAAGQKGIDYLFGELANAPISGTIYIDRNNDGKQDAGEPGIPNISLTVEVEDGPGNWVKVPGPAIVTDNNGYYTYPEAVTGKNYRVTETQPGDLGDGKENGTVNTGTPNVITISNLPSIGSSGNNFGEIAAVLSGVVYLDSNNNGIQDAGEPGLANVEVSLPASVKNVLGQGALTATTDANGNYVFQDLLAGTYAVTQQAAQPSYNGAPTINGITTAGSTGGVATSVATVPSAINGIVLNAGGTSENNNFGEVLQVSISGAVFLDVNNDGAMLGAAETGLDGVVIELSGVDDTGATVSLSTTTDKDGKFSFEGLRPGKYSLTEPTQPTGTANGITTAGSAGGTATPVTTVPSKITDIDLSVPGTASVDNLFGEIPRSSAISGKVWEDTNNNGVVDPGEKGIGGVTVELEGTAIDGTPIKLTVTTDADGNYSFDELPPGTYTVTEPNQPPGTLDGKTVPGSTGGTATAPGTTPSKISTIVVGVNETSKDNNFGEVPVGSIAGFVYNDSNDDGIKQNDEGGYAMIDVVLTGTDDLGNPVNVQGVTDAQGHYVFQNLRPGTYIVTEPTQPAETLNGLTTAGSIDGVKSGAKVTGKETVPSQIDGIVLKPGNNSVDNNFGEIGDSPDMLVSKASNTVKFTVNNVGSYTIRVRNGGQKPSFGEYIVKDRLPLGLTLAEVPTGNNWICSGAVGDARFECRSSEVVNVGTTSLSDITVKVNVGVEAANAGTVNNAVLIEGGGENEFRTPTVAERNTFEGNVGDLPVCDTAITQNVCRVPNQVQLSSSVGGTVWFDVGSEDTFLDGGDERLQSWIVELMDSVTGLVSQSTITAVDGSYRFADVIPGVKWNIQFRDPSSGVLWAWPVNQETAGGMGVACDSPRAIGNDGVSACRVSENGTSQLQVVLEAGQHLPQQSLPVDPSGVVYDAVTRDPVPGSIVTIAPVGVCTGYDPKTAILNAGAGGYRVEGNAVSMTVGNNGYYQFMFGPAAPARCEFQLTVTPPGGYQFVSSLIPAETGSLSPLGAAGSSHLVQPQTGAPTGAVGTPTQYWLTLFAGSATAGIVHNHIPLDTAQATGLVITKTGDRQTAEIGDTVQYTITVRQTAGSAMATLNVVDTLPRGFTYIDGTGRVGGRAVEDPFGKPGPRLGFNLGPINVGQQLVLTYRVRVGVGAQQGDGINRAQAHGCSISGGCIDPGTMTPVPGSIPSNRAEYRVRVTGGVFTEEACVLGKIFVDCNNNHVQDQEELGIPGVRMYFSNGTWMISDSEGKYSYCGLPPQSHTLKVDPSTLPVGARLTTSSNRNLGDADSLFLDLKNGELHRADFVEGSCSNPLLEQVKARRTQGEVRAPETETGQSQLRFDSKPVRAPQQATDSSNQRPIVQPRPNPPSAAAQQEVQP